MFPSTNPTLHKRRSEIGEELMAALGKYHRADETGNDSHAIKAPGWIVPVNSNKKQKYHQRALLFRADGKGCSQRPG
jgi:hypothetical protein